MYCILMQIVFQTGALDPSRPTMQAVREPRDFFTEGMVQRKGLSDRDAALVRKMYCMPGTIGDNFNF